MKRATTHRRASRVSPFVATAFAAATLSARVPPAEPGAKLFDAPSRVTMPRSGGSARRGRALRRVIPEWSQAFAVSLLPATPSRSHPSSEPCHGRPQVDHPIRP